MFGSPERPPVGFELLMPWRDAVGLTDDDFKRYEEHRRLIRIVTPSCIGTHSPIRGRSC